MKQTERLLNYLKENNSIDDFEALRKLSIKRLSARIHDLREEGYQIETVLKKGKNEYGTYKYARYTLHQNWKEILNNGNYKRTRA